MYIRAGFRPLLSQVDPKKQSQRRPWQEMLKTGKRKVKKLRLFSTFGIQHDSRLLRYTNLWVLRTHPQFSCGKEREVDNVSQKVSGRWMAHAEPGQGWSEAEGRRCIGHLELCLRWTYMGFKMVQKPISYISCWSYWFILDISQSASSS